MMPMSPSNDYEAECDVRTLSEAEKIESDPKRLAKARARAAQMAKELAYVAKDNSGDAALMEHVTHGYRKV